MLSPTFHFLLATFLFLILNSFEPLYLCDNGDSATLCSSMDNSTFSGSNDSSTLCGNKDDYSSTEYLEDLKNILSKQYIKYRISLDDYNRSVKLHKAILCHKIEGRAFYFRALSCNIDFKRELAKVRLLEERIRKIDPNFKLITRKQLFEEGNWFRKRKWLK